MKLNELFSPIGGPSEESDVNWLEDLKFFIDNDNEVMTNVLFPAIKKHQTYKGHPSAYKIYITPIERCKDLYCEKFNIEDPEEKFSRENLIKLARQISSQQEKFIERGDYED
jgi:hypothetical protein